MSDSISIRRSDRPSDAQAQSTMFAKLLWWTQRQRRLPIVATAIIGVLASFASYRISVAWERKIATIEFQSRAADHLAVINGDLQEAANVLDTLRVYFESNAAPVTRDEFVRFAGALHDRSSGLRDSGWAPRVRAEDRDRFERAARAAGLPEFEIKTVTPEGRTARADPAAEYFPIFYQDPPDKETIRWLLGVDPLLNPTLAAAMRRSIASGQPAATSPATLAGVKGTTMLGFVAVRAGVHQSAPNGAVPQGASAAPEGLVFGAFDLSTMLEQVVTRRRLEGLDIYLFNPLAEGADRQIYWRRRGVASKAVPDEANLRALPHLEGTVEIIDQKLGAIFLPSEETGSSHSWYVFMPPAVGLLLTAMIVAYLLASLHRTRQLEALTTRLSAKTETIEHMARHDELTGLPNRRLFAEELRHLIGQALQGSVPCAAMLVDLDRFKAVNDVHGHGAGDAVLREVARRLRANVRKDAVVARLGGDEFAVILIDDNVAQTGPVVAQRLIAALSRPIEIEQATVDVGATIGMAFCPGDGREPEALLRAADLAMYAAKRQERGTLCLFEVGMDDAARIRLMVQGDLRQAIAAGDIRPFYQPIFRLRDGALVGYEIVARWQHRQRGVIMPDLFIGLAESSGMIGELTTSLLSQVCADTMSWPDHLYLALNISPVQLRKPDLPRSLLALLGRLGFPAHRLEIEITESALVTNMEVALASLLALRGAGMRIALDDFGTGYSSLVHLQQLPLDKVKIDRSFVTHLLENRESAKIVAAIVALGKSLGISTTAEGIETEDIALYMAGLGCDFGQGYYFAKPMPADVAAAFRSRIGPDLLKSPGLADVLLQPGLRHE